MNLYQFSERNNYEMGVKIEKNIEKVQYDQLFDYVSIMLRESVKYELKRVEKETTTPKTKEQSQKKQEITQNIGYCIRCHNQMELNPNKPLCSKCYPIWAKYSDRTYSEKYCHICGKESKQSVDKPVCITCYKKLYK